MISKHILKITFLNKPELIFFFVHSQVIIDLESVFVWTQLNDQIVLFQTIQFSMSTKLNGFNYCYVSLIIQLNISHLFTHS